MAIRSNGSGLEERNNVYRLPATPEEGAALGDTFIIEDCFHALIDRLDDLLDTRAITDTQLTHGLEAVRDSVEDLWKELPDKVGQSEANANHLRVLAELRNDVLNLGGLIRAIKAERSDEYVILLAKEVAPLLAGLLGIQLSTRIEHLEESVSKRLTEMLEQRSENLLQDVRALHASAARDTAIVHERIVASSARELPACNVMDQLGQLIAKDIEQQEQDGFGEGLSRPRNFVAVNNSQWMVHPANAVSTGNEFEELSIPDLRVDDSVREKHRMQYSALLDFLTHILRLHDGTPEEEIRTTLIQVLADQDAMRAQVGELKRDYTNQMSVIMGLFSQLDLIKCEVGVQGGSEVMPAVRTTVKRLRLLEADCTRLQNMYQEVSTQLAEIRLAEEEERRRRDEAEWDAWKLGQDSHAALEGAWTKQKRRQAEATNSKYLIEYRSIVAASGAAQKERHSVVSSLDNRVRGGPELARPPLEGLQQSVHLAHIIAIASKGLFLGEHTVMREIAGSPATLLLTFDDGTCMTQATMDEKRGRDNGGRALVTFCECAPVDIGAVLQYNIVQFRYDITFAVGGAAIPMPELFIVISTDKKQQLVHTMYNEVSTGGRGILNHHPLQAEILSTMRTQVDAYLTTIREVHSQCSLEATRQLLLLEDNISKAILALARAPG